MNSTLELLLWAWAAYAFGWFVGYFKGKSAVYRELYEKRVKHLYE